MSKNKELLTDYATVTKELESIKNRVTVLKDITEQKMKLAKCDDDRSKIFAEFKVQIDKIKQDKSIKSKYKELQKKKNDIESQLLTELEGNKKESTSAITVPTLNSCASTLPECDTEKVEDELDAMINKYQKLIKQPIEYPKNQKPVRKVLIKKKENDGVVQVKKLYNLIESLKMDIDK